MTHLTQDERYQIFALLHEDFSIRYIAWRLNRSTSTISREIKRNKARNGYFAKHANKLVRARQCQNPKRILSNIWPLVNYYLNHQWRPELIVSHVVVSLYSLYKFIRQNKSKDGLLFHNLRF
ncbi:transposase [Acinetobacter thermotolerans]|uniref:transposase n=1 Tax=Acinetobacter thermotolerans TaxID=3151487 RepID=UPI003D312F65